MSNKDSPITQALRHRAKTEGAAPAVTPLFQTSAFEAGSEYFYTRNDNPNIREFEQAVAILEDAKHGLAVSTGMMAITLVAGLVDPDSYVLVHTHTYGCTLRHFQRMAKRKRFGLRVADLTKPSGIDALDENCGLVIFETPTNPFLYTIDISAVAKEMKTRCPNALLAVDNTWATPLFQRPIELGADISLHSATKYLSGHSDVMGGVILSNDDDIMTALREERFYSGAVIDPHGAWLLRRSLQTYPLRMGAHADTARAMVDFLQTRAEIDRVYYPEINQQLVNYGCIIFFQFGTKYSGCYERFLTNLRLFQSGTGMACVTSMVAQPYTGSHASLDDADKAAMGLDRDLVRLCFGLEDPDDLRADLSNALDALSE
jgi:cystathionine beta-lyase/cystathionine gamma-synthase